MTRGRGTQRFPAGAEIRTGLCTAPLHNGPAGDVVPVRLRLGVGPGIERAYFMCAECLADFAVAHIAGAYVLARGTDGEWHEVGGTVG